jgi:hypothetical protein
VNRANWIPAPHYFELNAACVLVSEAFDPYGFGLYLVGSSLERRDFRDVDVRCIMADEHFDRLFPDAASCPHMNALWSLLCASVSLYLSKHSGLPVDFQIQRQTEANAEHPGAAKRHPIGMMRAPRYP